MNPVGAATRGLRAPNAGQLDERAVRTASPAEVVETDGGGPLLSPALVIELATSFGTGPTVLAAFDDALVQAGVANHNLIRLSSVIPPASELLVCDGPTTSGLGAWGDRLYVVMAEQRESRPGQEAWAGIGWVQEETTGRGLFVEHEGHDETWLHEQIHASLGAMVTSRPEVGFGPVQSVVRGGQCSEAPVCALAVAVYAAEPWRDQTIDLRNVG